VTYVAAAELANCTVVRERAVGSSASSVSPMRLHHARSLLVTIGWPATCGHGQFEDSAHRSSSELASLLSSYDHIREAAAVFAGLAKQS